MPYYRRRRYRPRRRRRYRRRGKPARYHYADMAYKGYKMGLKAMKFLNTEHKYLDFNQTNTASWNGTLFTLNSIPQGDTDVTRDGDSVKIMSCMLRYNVSYATNCVGRIIVFWDKQNAITAVSDVLALAALGTANAPNAPKPQDKRFMTKILFDSKHSVNQNGQAMFTRSKQIPIGLHTQFNAGTTTINSGALKMLIIGSVAVGPTFDTYARVTYVDN